MPCTTPSCAPRCTPPRPRRNSAPHRAPARRCSRPGGTQLGAPAARLVAGARAERRGRIDAGVPLAAPRSSRGTRHRDDDPPGAARGGEVHRAVAALEGDPPRPRHLLRRRHRDRRVPARAGARRVRPAVAGGPNMWVSGPVAVDPQPWIELTWQAPRPVGGEWTCCSTTTSTRTSSTSTTTAPSTR